MSEKVLICGSRGWDDIEAIEWEVGHLARDAIVIHGGANGADVLAGSAARRRGMHTAVVEPLWDTFGKSAGHRRNAAMLDLQPDLVIAFSLGTNGTEGTIAEATRRGIPTVVRRGAKSPRETTRGRKASPNPEPAHV